MGIEPRISLIFYGECDVAFSVSDSASEARDVSARAGASPMADQGPAEWRDKVLDATLQVGGMAFSGADVLPGADQCRRVFGFRPISRCRGGERIFWSSQKTEKSSVPCSRPSGHSDSAKSWTASGSEEHQLRRTGRGLTLSKPMQSVSAWRPQAADSGRFIMRASLAQCGLLCSEIDAAADSYRKMIEARELFAPVFANSPYTKELRARWYRRDPKSELASHPFP